MIIVEAPAKINLHLSVGEKRSDGYHDVSSIVCALTFGDKLFFEYADTDSVNFLSPSKLDVEDNSVYKALQLFKQRTGFKSGIKVSVEKRIPLGSGLGGGSSDAASTLMALNKMSGMKLSTDILHGMAQELGSDVPFFLYGSSAWVGGRGENVRPILLPERDLWVILVFPDFQSSTAEAFGILDRLRPKREAAYLPEDVLIQAIKDTPSKWPYRNDFLEYSLHKDFYTDILQHLLFYGADFVGLSGSGSTCFGILQGRRQGQPCTPKIPALYQVRRTTLRQAGPEAGPALHP